MTIKPMKTIKFGQESDIIYEVTDEQTRSKITSLEDKLQIKLDKSIVQTSDPTSSTIGSIGQTYINTITESVFICIKADNTNKNYIWKDISEIDLSNYYTKPEVDELVSTINPLPAQEDNDGKALVTNGLTPSWDYIINLNDSINQKSDGLPKLVINRLTQSEYDELLNSGQINDNEFYITDEKYYTKEELNEIISSVIAKQTTFIYNQTEESQIWIIEHNLNKYPSITTVDTNGNEFSCQKTYIDSNTIKITCSSPMAGQAFLN